MNNYIKESAKRGFYGSFIGLSIGYTVLMLLFTFDESFVVDPNQVILHYFAALVVGFWMTASTIIFDIDEWSLLKQTTIHSFFNLPYLLVAFLMGWIPEGALFASLFILGYFAIYAIIWILSKQYWMKKARELNKSIHQMNK